jgi:hypothetical protein
MKTCETCRFWKDRLRKGEGECRISPPVLSEALARRWLDSSEVNEGFAVYASSWPGTTSEDFCGKHEEKR